MEVQYNKARPFPKFIFTVILLLVIAVAVYLVCFTIPASRLIDYYEMFGGFICRYDKPLIAFIVIVNVLELIDYFVFAKRDEAINANYEYMQNHIGMRVFFKQYFAPMFTKGPYIFATEEKKSAPIRKIVNLFAGLVKFIFWLAFALIILSGFFHPDFKSVLTEGNRDYFFTAIVLFAFTNCNVFVYALYRITPLYSSRTYLVETYYSDHSSVTTERTESNVIAIIFLSAFIYLYFSVLYIFAFANKLVRTVETNRLLGFIGKSDDFESMLSFYEYK